jgi:hypothetical protein
VKGCRRVRWQGPGTPTSLIALHQQTLTETPESKQEIRNGPAENADELQNDHGDSQSSDEAEHEYVEEDNGEVEIESQQETSQNIKNTLCNLHQVDLDPRKWGPTREIARYSSFCPSRSSGSSEISIFLARAIGGSPSQ